MSEQQPHRFDERLSRLEAVVEGVASNMVQVTNDVRNLAQTVQSSIRAAIKDRRVNWGWIFAGGSVGILLIGFMVRSELGPTATGATRNAESIAALEAHELTEAYSRGRRDARLDQHDRDIDEIKKALGLRGMP